MTALDFNQIERLAPRSAGMTWLALCARRNIRREALGGAFSASGASSAISPVMRALGAVSAGGRAMTALRPRVPHRID